VSDTLIAAIVGAVAGIITGSIGSLFAPWATWGIEKRKQKLARQRELVDKWRVMLSEIQHPEDTHGQLGSVLSRHPHWPSLKPHLPEEAMQMLQMNWHSNLYTDRVKSPNPATQEAILSLMDDVGNIEKRWELV
jgi:hypothetical protein